jgi:hypothetical protein
MKRNQTEIDSMVQKLSDLKKTLPQYSFFGDNNWEAIDEQMHVIKNDIDQDEIYEGNHDDNVENAAISAYQWLNGEIEEDEFI